MPITTEPDVRERWGDALRLARLAKRESQAETGAATGMAAATVAKAELGRGSVDTYSRIARHHGVVLELGETTP